MMAIKDLARRGHPVIMGIRHHLCRLNRMRRNLLQMAMQLNTLTLNSMEPQPSRHLLRLHLLRIANVQQPISPPNRIYGTREKNL